MTRGERIVAHQQRVFERAVRHADLRMVAASERLLFNFETNFVLARERRAGVRAQLGERAAGTPGAVALADLRGRSGGAAAVPGRDARRAGPRPPLARSPAARGQDAHHVGFVADAGDAAEHGYPVQVQHPKHARAGLAAGCAGDDGAPAVRRHGDAARA